MSISGSCLCQTITFSIPEKVIWSAHCHCSLCRKAHAAAFVTWVGIKKNELKLLTGEKNIVWYQSSEQGKRAHCNQCGTPLFFYGDRWPEEIHVPRALLDDELNHPVQAHAFYDAHVEWTHADSHLPKRGGVSGTEPLED